MSAFILCLGEVSVVRAIWSQCYDSSVQHILQRNASHCWIFQKYFKYFSGFMFIPFLKPVLQCSVYTVQHWPMGSKKTYSTVLLLQHSMGTTKHRTPHITKSTHWPFYVQLGIIKLPTICEAGK